MKNLILTVILYGLLFNFYSVASPCNTENYTVGLHYSHFWDLPNVVVMACTCMEDDLILDDDMGRIRVVGKNSRSIRKNALFGCQAFFGNDYTEFYLTACTTPTIVDPNDNTSNLPSLGVITAGRTLSFHEYRDRECN